MSATTRQVNWTAVGFTPSGGSLTTITGVTSVDIERGGKLTTFSGDGNLFPTTIVNTMNNPSVTVEAADVATVTGFVPGTVGTFTATFKDAKGATGGDIVYTLINAVIADDKTKGAHQQFGMATLSIQAYSSDGTTSPLSFTRV